MAKRPKRAHGEGSYRIRADGRHEWAGPVRTASGGTRRISLYGKTRKEVQAKLARVRADEARYGWWLEPDRRLLHDYCEAWLETVVSVRNRPGTVLKYRYDLRRILKHIDPRTTVSGLTAEQVRRALRAMQDERTDDGTPRYSATTLERSLDVLHNALQTLVEDEQLRKNVVAAVDPPKAAPYEPYILSDEETDRLLAAARGTRYSVLIALYVHYGLRRGEGLGLRVRDIDLRRGEIRPTKAVITLGNRSTLADLKTDESQSPLPILPEMESLLRAQIQEAREVYAALRVRFPDRRFPLGEELLFPSETGTFISPRNLLRAWKAILARAGLPARIRIHDLRHSLGTWLARQGYDLKTIQAILRHADPRTTMIYITSATSHQRDALSARASRLHIDDAYEEAG